MLFIFFVCLPFYSFAQYTLRIEILSAPDIHKDDSVFVAGNFNKWASGSNSFIFLNENNKLVIEIKNLPSNTYQFKFTRGNWQRVESASTGFDIENRVIKLSSDTICRYTIEGWKDDFIFEKKHTASSGVRIIDTAFNIPQLNKTRRIWIYLPQGYEQTKNKYPVMYLQDGQNLFDEFTSSFGEWGIDECLDSLIKKGKQACIVVGIDNGGQSRMNEYNPYEFIWKDSLSPKKFLPQGNEYLNFISQTLKPFIDKHYRTVSTKENTIIAGSSMGGLISYYAALKYPEVFGKAGIFSPSFWIAPEINVLTDSIGNKLNGKYFFYIGQQEGDTFVMEMKRIADKLGAKSNAMIYSVLDENGKHNEKAWRKWFAEFYCWIMADGYNNVIKLE